MVFDRRWHTGLGVALLALVAAASVQAQGQVQYPGQPQFRDPKTGQIWTPENVGGKSGPNTPEDRAFNPQGQTAVVRGTSVQTPSVTVLGSIPITAGPTVPIATIDDASLTAIPSQRWQVVLYFNNNSAAVIDPVIGCRFTNGGNLVEDVRANLPPVAGGQRVGLTVYGPETTLFVDRAECRIDSPR